MQTRKQTAEESGQSSPPVLVVVVIRREKEISLAANIGMDGHMSIFCEERKFVLKVFFRFSFQNNFV